MFAREREDAERLPVLAALRGTFWGFSAGEEDEDESLCAAYELASRRGRGEKRRQTGRARCRALYGQARGDFLAVFRRNAMHQRTSDDPKYIFLSISGRLKALSHGYVLRNCQSLFKWRQTSRSIQGLCLQDDPCGGAAGPIYSLLCR